MREGEENTHVQTLQWRRITVELSPSGYVRYIEMDGAVAMNVCLFRSYYELGRPRRSLDRMLFRLLYLLSQGLRSL